MKNARFPRTRNQPGPELSLTEHCAHSRIVNMFQSGNVGDTVVHGILPGGFPESGIFHIDGLIRKAPADIKDNVQN